MTADSARRYLIAYDIPDDKRRTRLSKRLLAYGDRIQYSVFVSDLKPARLVRLRTTIRDVVEPEEDSVLVCDLGPVRTLSSDVFSFIGLDKAVTPHEAIVV